jgi:type II secretory pathway component PulK
MKTRAYRSQSGVVLVAVLVVCMGLVAVTLLFTSTAMMDYRAIKNDLAGRQAEQAVEGGARYAQMLIQGVETPGTMPDRTSYTASELELGSGYFWIIGRPDDTNSNITEPQWGLVDEASKLNLNNPDLTADMLMNLPGMTQDLADAIISWRNTSSSSRSDTYSQRQPPYHRKSANFDSIAELALLDGADPAVLAARDLNLNNPDLTAEMLLNLPGMTQDLADAIISWRNTSSSARSDTYSQRQPPYHRKGANFDSIAELALLDGADPATLAARDLNLNGLVDTYENDSRASLSSMSGTTTTDGPGIWEYVTVFSRELNPPTKLLATSVGPTSPVAQMMLQKLDPAVAQAALALLRNASDISGPLDFLIRSQMKEEDFDLIADQLRFTDKPTIYPVNIYTASATVLACIPGIDSSLAQQIVSDRANQPTTSTGLGWLAKEFAGNPEGAKKAAPFLTGKTYVISADVAGVGHNGRGYRRTKFVFDRADDGATTAKLIYRRNLSSVGWALGREARNNLAQERIGG